MMGMKPAQTAWMMGAALGGWQAGAASRVMAQMPQGLMAGDSYPHPEQIVVLPALREPWPWWAWLLLTVGAVGLAVLLWRWVVKKRPPRLPAWMPAGKKAVLALEKLKAQLETLSPAEAAHRVSVIVRVYQEDQYAVPAPYRTREELYERQQWTQQWPEALRSKFGALAAVHDRLAFAPQPSTHEDVRVLIDAALAALREDAAPSGRLMPVSQTS